MFKFCCGRGLDGWPTLHPDDVFTPRKMLVAPAKNGFWDFLSHGKIVFREISAVGAASVLEFNFVFP